MSRIPWTAKTFPKNKPIWIKHRQYMGDGCSMIVAITKEGAYMATISDDEDATNFLSWELLMTDYRQHNGDVCGFGQ